jgi:glycosyltransferase involved in cell wall biosynthesis
VLFSLKVCLVNSFYPPYIGGAETYVSNLARGLARTGHDVTVYCSDRPLPRGRSEEEGVRVVRMSTPLTLYGTPIAGFPPELVTEDYDVIHCNFPNPYFSIVSAAVSRLKGTPAVLTWHNDLPAVTKAASLLVGAHDALSNLYLSAYRRIIATTGIYARSSATLRKHRGRVRVIPNGVDTKRFNPDAECEWAKEKYGLKGYKTLIFVGALTTWHAYKGLDVLLHAFRLVSRECDKIKLLVVGGGNLLGHYQRLARGLGVGERVVFAGRVDDDALPGCYAASDIGVLPSRDPSEGFGLALLEAMACGKAVIGSDVGGIPEVIDDWKTGVLVAPKDPEALANAVHALCVDDGLRDRMGAAGREFALTRDWGIVADRVSSLYEEVQW